MKIRILLPVACCLLATPLAAQSITQDATLDRLHLPAENLTFIENRGQWSDDVRFLARLDGADLWVTDKGLVVDFYQLEKIPADNPHSILVASSEREGMRRWGRVVSAGFVGGRAQRVEGRGQHHAYQNYFLGNEPSRWASLVPLYDEVFLHDIYEGVTLRLYASGGVLVHDLLTAPGTDLATIQLELKGVEGLGRQTPLDHAVALGLPARRSHAHDSRFFTRDGELNYSSYFGGSGKDRALAVDTDVAGNVYVGGRTLSNNLFPPGPGSYDGELDETLNCGGNPCGDAFVAKLNPNLSGKEGLVYASYFGAEGFEEVRDLVVGDDGGVYLTGITTSDDFPLSPNPIQDSINFDLTTNTRDDAFIAQFSPEGNTLAYSTYLGGEGNDGGRAIALDSQGYIYVTALTISKASAFEDALATPGAFQPTNQDELSSRIADIFLVQIDTTRTGSAQIVYGTFLGGSSFEEPIDIVVVEGSEAGDNPDVFIVGTASSTTGEDEDEIPFPTTGNAYRSVNPSGTGEDPNHPSPNNLRLRSAFVSILSLDGLGDRDLLYSTYLGGRDHDGACGVGVHEGNIYVGGYTRSFDFFQGDDLTGVFDAVYDGPNPIDSRDFGGDLFIAVLDTSQAGSDGLEYGTFLGGNGSEESGQRGAPVLPIPVCGFDVDDDGVVYMSGVTDSPNFPVTDTSTPSGRADAFLVRLRPEGTGNDDLLFGTYLGGSDDDEALDLARTSNLVYLVGETESRSGTFPVTPGAYDNSYNGGDSDSLQEIEGDAFVTGYEIISEVNNPPRVLFPIADLTLAPLDPDSTIDLTAIFDDPDDDSLTFECIIQQDGAAVILPDDCADGSVDVRPLAVGAATVTVTATDPLGASANDTFEVDVVNNPPRVEDPIDVPPLVLKDETQPFTIDNLNDVFTDDDEGQSLIFECFVEKGASIVDLLDNCKDGSLGIGPASVGTATLIVTADDTFGAMASDTFDVRVREPVAEYAAILKGLSAVPPSSSQASGTVSAVLDGKSLSISGSFSDFEEALGTVQVRVAPVGASGNPISDNGGSLTTEGSPPGSVSIEGTFTLNASERTALLDERVYVHVAGAADNVRLRGQLLPEDNRPPSAFSILTPTNGAEILIGPGEGDVTVTWSESEEEVDFNRVAYVWELAPDLDEFDDPLLLQSTTEKNITIPLSTLDDLLGISAEAEWFHRVSSTDGSEVETTNPFRLFLRRVSNPPPEPLGLPDVTLVRDSTYRINNLNAFFEDDDPLTYGVTCASDPDSDPDTEPNCDDGPVDVFRADTTLLVIAQRVGADTVSVCADDEFNDPVCDPFVVTVVLPLNFPPQIVETIPDTTVFVGGGPVEINLRAYFSDPENDALEFRCNVEGENSPSVVRLTNCETGNLKVEAGGNSTGMATISIVAGDGRSESEPNLFTVKVDPALPISFGPLFPSSPEPESGGPVTITVAVSNVLDGGSVALKYRQGGASDFSETPMNGDGTIYTATIPGTSVTSRGVECFAEASNPNVAAVRSETLSLRVQVSALAYGRSLPAGDAQTGYRMISVPLALDNASAGNVLDELGEPDDDAWRLFELLPPGTSGSVPAAGTADQQYREGPSGVSLSRGKAVWLIAREGGTFDTGSGITTAPDEAFPVSLHGGWNLVGSPFNFEVPVDRLRLASGAPVQLQAYTGAWQNETSRMMPFAGYALRVDDETELIIDPIAGAADRMAPGINEEGESAKSSVPAWAVRIAATVEQARDDNNLALVAPAATDERDALDWYEPPAIGDHVSVAFDQADGGAPLTVDARPVPEDGAVWPLVVRSNIRGEVALDFSGLNGVPASFVAWLVDEAAGTVTDLKSDASYAFGNQGNSAPVRMRLIIGTETFAQATSGFESTVPSDFELAQNYPNPFQKVTTIQYGLPSDEHVVLEVFDVVGRRVAVLVDEEQVAGYHKAVWNGRGMPGGLASGTYVYRLRAGSFVAAEQMVVVR